MSDPTPNLPTPATSSAAPLPASNRRKPRLSLAFATAFGLGYLPVAPGTFGSLGGAAVALLIWSRYFPHRSVDVYAHDVYITISPPSFTMLLITILISAFGILAASRTASYLGRKDPSIVVIDEVSGQLITYLGIGSGVTNWKYLLLGFILFRVFDIWKPFPARQAESLPGGLGIMADDWIAGIYAAIGLWIALAIGL